MALNAISLLSIISIALAFHGVALAILIVITKKPNRLTITYAALLSVLSLILVEYFFSYSRLEEVMPHLIAIKIPLLMLIGPLYFLWTSYKAGKEAVMQDAIHIIPFVLMILVLGPFYILPAAEKNVVAASDEGFLIRNFYLVITFLHLLFYVILTRYKKKDYAFKAQEQTLFSQLHQGFLILLFAFGIAIIYAIFGNVDIGFGRFLFILALGLIINFLAYVLLKKPNSFLLKQRINHSELNRLAVKVRRYLEAEKPYLKKGFSKSELSDALDSNENYISKVFNDILKTSFTTYINELRIEEAKQLLLKNDDKIYAIAIDSGFASKNNFTRVFKQHTKHTPAEFRSINKQ